MHTIEFYIDEQDEPVYLIARWKICDDCRGEGYSTLHGMEITDWDDWDEDDREEYFHGTGYRTPCVNPGCFAGKELELDPDSNSAEIINAYNEYLVSQSQYEAEREAERRMGC